jgi:hypothetical protein
MPDIAMCKGDNCPSKHTCYRFLATPSEYVQSYFHPTPNTETGKCDEYWEARPIKDKKR